MAPLARAGQGTAGPLGEGRAPVRERLIAMLCLTALLHAILILGLTFTGGIQAGGKDTPQLDVMLVTNDAPEAASNLTAAYLSQRTQRGSGNALASQRTGTPASQGPAWSARSTETPADAPDADAERSSGTTRVLTSSAPVPDIRYFASVSTGGAPVAADMPVVIGDTEGPARAGQGDTIELLLKGKPEQQHWVVPDTQASRLAPYLAGWKRKVERVGSLHFPAAARGAGLSGSPVIEVEISADGHLASAGVRRTSGHGELDQAALTILRLASPFDPFPADLASDYQRLRFAYQWDFVAGTLQTGAVTASSDGAAGP